MANPFLPAAIRNQFPSLKRKVGKRPLIFMDAHGGTQVPTKVMNAITDYYKTSNSNSHGTFITTQERDEVINTARKSAAALLNAESAHCISFGQNMTTLNYSLARAIGRVLQPGDEILITQLDHEGNRGPWLSLRELGIIVREVNLLPDGQLDYDDFESKIIEPRFTLL